jgi:hypothetical protein
MEAPKVKLTPFFQAVYDVVLEVLPTDWQSYTAMVGDNAAIIGLFRPADRSGNRANIWLRADASVVLDQRPGALDPTACTYISLGQPDSLELIECWIANLVQT